MPGRPLNATELDRYRLIPHALATRVRVHRIAALPSTYAGITLGRRVFLAVDVPSDGTSSLLAHELVHVRQWHEQGFAGFSIRYATSFLAMWLRTRSWHQSYLAIPAEREARYEAARWSKRSHRSA